MTSEQVLGVFLLAFLAVGGAAAVVYAVGWREALIVLALTLAGIAVAVVGALAVLLVLGEFS